MIYSMTGYANKNLNLDGFLIQIDIRSINFRFFDLSIKSPEPLRVIDQELRQKIMTKITRGKIELRIHCQESELANLQIKLNLNLLNEYLRLEQQIKDLTPNVESSSIDKIINFPGMLIQPTSKYDEINSMIINEIDTVINELIISQEIEGNKLANSILSKITLIDEIVDKCIKLIPKISLDYQLKLKHRLLDTLNESIINEQRLQQEFAYFCQKSDIDEELTRLKSHIKQCQNLIQQGGMIGKKIDFMTQEMNREANTISSKSSSIEIINYAVELKFLIEQIREQIQNVL